MNWSCDGAHFTIRVMPIASSLDIPLTPAILWWYWSLLGVAAVGGVVLIMWGFAKRRGWWWKMPLGLLLIIGPYWADLALTRIIVIKESPTTAWLPTGAILSVMAPEDVGLYGVVFDRYHKAPPRHAMWQTQRDDWARWCGECVKRNHFETAKRGVQIAGTLAPESDEAIGVLGQALAHPNPAVAKLAGETLWGVGKRAAMVRDQIEAATESVHESVRDTAQSVLDMLDAQE